MPPLPLTAVFDGLPDPRRDTRNKLHRLTDLLVIATCAVIGGAESWEAIAEYGRTKESFFRRFLPLEHGIASPDTFERAFAKLAPGAFASLLPTSHVTRIFACGPNVSQAHARSYIRWSPIQTVCGPGSLSGRSR